jgi:phage-related protein
MAEIASAWVSILPSAKGFDSKLTSEVGGGVKSAGKSLGASFGKLFAAAAALGIGAKVVSFFGDSIAEAREAQKVGAQTEAVIKSTGAAAGLTAEQFEEMAGRLSAISGIDDEVIQGGENILATFTNIKDFVGGQFVGTFDAATQTALDMSVALGTDMKSSAILVGKALNDPLKGLTALTRVGVSFTEQQRKQIASMVEGGRVADAQALILAELTKEFGGSAAAQATAADKAAVAWGNFKEAVGTALLPVLDRLATFFTNTIIPALEAALPKIQGFFSNIWNAVQPIVAAIGDALMPVFQAIGDWISSHSEIFKTFGASLGGVGAAAVVVAGAIAGIAAALAFITSPIVLVVGGLAALVTGLVLAYKHSEGFRNVVNAVGQAIVDFGTWIKTALLPFVVQLAQKVGQNLQPIFTQLAETWRNDVAPALKKVIDKFIEWQPAMRRVAAAILSVIGRCIEIFTTIQGKVVPVLIRLVAYIVSNVISAIVKFVKACIDIGKALFDFGQKIRDVAEKVADWARMVTQKVADVVRVFVQLPGKVTSALAGLASQMFTLGRQMMEGFINGVKSMASSIAGAAKDAVQGAINGVKGLLNIGSPSRLFHQFGVWTMEGYANGVHDGNVRWIGPAWDEFLKATLARLEKVRDGIKTKLGEMRSDFQSLRDSISSAFTPDLFGDVTNIGDFLSGQRAANFNIAEVLDAFEKLKKDRKQFGGISQAFLNALLASGNTDLILSTAGASIADIQAASGQFMQGQSLANQLGSNVAHDAFDRGVKRLENRLATLNESIHEVRDAIKGEHRKASDGQRKRKGS